MAKTQFSRGVRGPYKLRTTGEPRLIKQQGSIALSPARQRQLLDDLKDIGFQGDFMVTSDYRTFPSVFNIFNKRMKTYEFDKLIEDHPELKNLVESLAMRTNMSNYMAGANPDNPAQHPDYNNENLPEIWRPANWRTELKRGLRNAGLSQTQIKKWEDKMADLRWNFGGFGSKHLQGGKVDIYQNMMHRPGGAEMLQKLQDKGYYFHPERIKKSGSYLWDISFPGIKDKASSHDFKNLKTKKNILGYRPWSDFKSEKKRIKEETTSPLLSGIDEEVEEVEVKESEPKNAFDKAFREARAAGLREFMWTNNDPNSKLFGKTYSVQTRVAGESEDEWNRNFPPTEVVEEEEERIKTKVQPDPRNVPDEVKKEPIDESIFKMDEKSKFDEPPTPEISPEQMPLDAPKPYGVFAKDTPEFEESEDEQIWKGKDGGEVKKYENGGEVDAGLEGEEVEEKEEIDMNWEEADIPPYDFDSGVKKVMSDKPLTPEELGQKPEEPKSFEDEEMETKKMAELKSFFDDGQTDILWQYTSEELKELRDKHVGSGATGRDKLNDLIIKKKKYEHSLGDLSPHEGSSIQDINPEGFRFESEIVESDDIKPRKGQYHKGVFYPAPEEKGGEFRGKGATGSWEDPTPTKGLPAPPVQERPRPAPKITMPPKSPQEEKQEKDEFQIEQERLNKLQQQKMTDVENTLRATDPNRYWNNLGTVGKINAGLAMIFGLASPDGRNAGVVAIQKAIDDDIAQQKLEQDVEVAKKKIALEKVTKKIDNMMKFRKDQSLNEKTKLESDKLKAEIKKLDMEGKATARINTKRALIMAGKIPFESLSYTEKMAILGKKGMDQFSDLYDKYNKSSEKVQIGLALNTLGSIREYARMQDGIGDTAILFRVLKLLDPNSVVREGEFANAQKSGNALVERLKRTYDEMLTPGGPSLTPSQRDRWVRVALTQARQVKNQHDVINKRFDKHAKALGLPTVTTTYNLFENDPVARKRYKMFVKIKKANPQFRNKEILDAMKRKGIPLLQ